MNPGEAVFSAEVSSALLRVRINIFERRIRSLEEDQTNLAREIERNQERGEPCVQLRDLERENDILLLDQLQQVQRMRRELERREPSSFLDEEDDDGRVAQRREFVQTLLCFQVIDGDEGNDSSEEAKDSRSSSGRIRSEQSPSSNTMTECSICLDTYQPGDKIGRSKTMECHHAFHAECLLTWLEWSDCCPLCRVNIVSAAQVETTMSGR